MSDTNKQGLRRLQRLDDEIREAKKFLAEFDPMLAEVEDPALRLESEVERTRSRLQEMRLEERRLEVTTREKRTRIEKLTERLNQVRNVREESAVNTELDMVRSALESDEQEALSLLDHIRSFELRLEEETSAWEQAKEEVAPRQKELLEKREGAQARIAEMESQRSAFAADLDASVLRIYDAIHGGGKRKALSLLTEDGACGNCFSMVPLQLQQEIRDGADLIRCEGCGVILVAPDEQDAREAEEAAAKQAEAEAAEADDAEAEAETEDGGVTVGADDAETPEE